MDSDLDESFYSQLKYDNWKRQNGLKFAGQLDFDQYIEIGDCQPNFILDSLSYRRDCVPIIEKIISGLSYVQQIAVISAELYNEELKEVEKELSALLNRWEVYFEDARSQHPLELVINKWSYDRRYKDVDEFLPVPNYQWIVLHPRLVYEYIDASDAGNKFDESVVIELIGYNRWDWVKDNSTRQENIYGVSLIASYSDRAGVDNFGWGVMGHYDHKYSLGSDQARK